MNRLQSHRRRHRFPALSRAVLTAIGVPLAGWLLASASVASPPTTPLPPLPPLVPAVAAQPPGPSAAARAWARHVIASQDHAGLPFAVVDKAAAQVVLHRPDGSVAGISPALLGSQRGDHSEPGVGERTQAGTLRPSDMTTPAGRFVAVPGHNRSGEAVLWLDEDVALALHRLRPGRTHAGRARALAQHSPAQRRMSAGCVVVPAAFFDTAVMSLLGRRSGVVYVLPEAGVAADTLLAGDATARRSPPSALE